MIIEVDSRNCDEAIEEIRKIPHLHNVNFDNHNGFFTSFFTSNIHLGDIDIIAGKCLRYEAIIPGIS